MTRENEVTVEESPLDAGKFQKRFVSEQEETYRFESRKIEYIFHALGSHGFSDSFHVLIYFIYV